MLAGYFKRNKTQAVLALPAVVAALWVFPFFHPTELKGEHLMPLYDLLVHAVGDKPYLQYAIAALLLIGECFLINHVAVEQEILTTPTYMPGLVYGVFMSCNSQLTMLHPVLCANLFILLAVNRLFSTHRKETAFSETFDAGFYVAIASLFYIPSFVFMLLVWISLVLIRPFVWREWVISLIGFIVPYLFAAMYFYWMDKFWFLWYDKIFYPISLSHIELDRPITEYFLLGIMVFITLVSLTRVFRGVAINTVRAKNNILALLWMCGISLASVFIAPQFNLKYFAFLAIPCSVFAANYFLSIKRSWFVEFLFTVLLLAIVLGQLKDMGWL